MSKTHLIKKETENFNSSISAFNRIFDALAEFKGHYDKKFNATKLFEFLGLSKGESNQTIELILKIQNMFVSVFNEYELEKKKISNVDYFVAKKKIKNIDNRVEENTIELNKQNADIVNDMVYMFKYVERGKGFDLDNGKTNLLQKLKILCLHYPYFFQKNGNNLYYPSHIAQKLGDLLFTYKKNNKMFEEIQIEDCKIKIKNDDS